MDMLLVMLTVIIAGVIKISKVGGLSEFKPPVLQKDGSVAYSNVNDIPIGNNLSLRREPEAFTKIIKQLGLRA